MNVILLERIEKLGQMGDVVKVKPGFARNFLLPQKKALRATKENQVRFDSQRVHLEAANLKRREEAAAVATKMTDLSVLIIRQAGESGMLYGSVTGRDVATAIVEAGYNVERHQVQLDVPIKSLGSYPLRVSLHPEVTLTVTVNVARSKEEAERAIELQAEEAAKAAVAAAEPAQEVAAPSEEPAESENTAEA